MTERAREVEIRTVFGDPSTDPMLARVEEAARRAGLVLDDPELAAALARMPGDEAIPDRLFEAAAAALAYLVAVEEGAPPGLSR